MLLRFARKKTIFKACEGAQWRRLIVFFSGRFEAIKQAKKKGWRG
jgi:hypothetical protein